jgi:hypothetical protein
MDGLTEEESAIVSLVGQFVDREVRLSPKDSSTRTPTRRSSSTS